MLVVGVLIVIAIVVVLLAVLSSGSSNKHSSTTPAASSPAARSPSSTTSTSGTTSTPKAQVVGQSNLNPPGGKSNVDQKPLRTEKELVAAHDKAVAEARDVLKKTNEEHLQKPWKLLVSGKTVDEDPRYIVLRDTLMHMAHHRGQAEVYLGSLEVTTDSQGQAVFDVPFTPPAGWPVHGRSAQTGAGLDLSAEIYIVA